MARPMAKYVNKDRRLGLWLGLGSVLVLYWYCFILIYINKITVSYMTAPSYDGP